MENKSENGVMGIQYLVEDILCIRVVIKFRLHLLYSDKQFENKIMH